MSFQITGPGLYRTRDGRKAEVIFSCSTISGKLHWEGVIGDYAPAWWEDGRMHENQETLDDIIARWEEPVAPAEATPITPPPTPYHRTEQFRAETARMVMAAVVNRLGIRQPCIPDVVQQTDALIAALDQPQPQNP